MISNCTEEALVYMDFSDNKESYTVIDSDETVYFGQPDTVMLKDRSIIAAYPLGHGGPHTVLKKTMDNGLHWGGRIEVPDSFKGHQNAPTIHRLKDKFGVERLVVIVSFPIMMCSISEDDGESWSDFRPMFNDHPLNKPGSTGHAPPKTVVQISDNRYIALYHTDERDPVDHKKRVLTLMKTFTEDGGLTWSAPQLIDSNSGYIDAKPCEPAVIKSPDGNQLLCLIRNNDDNYNSFMMLSDDCGETWSEMIEMPDELTGHRHMPIYTNDGHLIVAFRDMSESSPYYGHPVIWIGQYDDIIEGKTGKYKVKLFDNQSEPWDTGYCGLELLDKDELLLVTYGVMDSDTLPVILGVKFSMDKIL